MITASAAPLDQDDLIRARTRAPKLANVNEANWTAMRVLGYRLARQVRHDIVNLQTGMQMLEAVEQMVQAGGAQDLPPDTNLEELRQSAKLDFHRTVQMSSVVSFLAQAGNPEAYAPSRCVMLSEMIELGITSQLPAGDPMVGALQTMCGGIEMVAMGDMLPMALNTCFFQWAPMLHDPVQARQTKVMCNGYGFEISIPADDLEGVTQFRTHAQSELSTLAREVAEGSLRMVTTALALLTAGHIMAVHGGSLAVEGRPEAPTLSLSLPLPQCRCLKCPECLRKQPGAAAPAR
jgi:hypothetical protein